MKPYERRQLHDEIVAGTYDICDLSMKQLKQFKDDFDISNEDYRPTGEFFEMIEAEMERRREKEAASKPMKPIDRGFFG